ncbi:hypothetical protein H8959_022677 [Pygathrix nigripes]
MRSATASASATTSTAAAWRLRPSPEAASWLRPPVGTRSRACSAPAAAASCAPSSARGAARASLMPRTPDSPCCPRAAGTASWRRARSVTAALARSAATSAALPTTARCARGPKCAHGDCCVHCLLKPAGALCRQAMGDCDLPEFCTGISSHCPPDVYLLDGSPCARGSGYCWDGACPTLEQQCQQLWGPGSHPAPEACFQVVNSVGDAHGNCGQDSKGHFLPCAGRDALCGKLQCQGGKPSLLIQHMVPVDSTVHLDGHEVTCRGALALPGAQLDLLGLGMVEPGTQCGPRMVCQSRRCENTVFQELHRCLTACHSHGVCNSNHNCHCAPGWAPPFCDNPGFGGSMDSGPVQPENRDTFLLAMLLSVLLPLLPGAGLAWCCYRLPGAHLQRCSWGCRRDPACSGPKDGPHRDHPLGGVHPMELGPTATGQPWALGPENSHEPSSHPEKPVARSPA